MYKKQTIIFLLICISNLYFINLCAKESGIDPIKNSENFKSSSFPPIDTSDFIWKPCISPFVELLGKGFLSLNVDFRIKESYSISIGFQPTEGLMPDVMFYYFGGKRRRFELGGGFSAGFSNDYSLAGMLIHGVIGYRYQQKKGLFFRAGLTPLYVIFFDEKDNQRSNKLYPFVGLSLGRSF
jgi:hypothetical protein